MWKKNLHTRIKDNLKQKDLFGKGLGFQFSSTTMPGGFLSVIVYGLFFFFVFGLVKAMVFYEADSTDSVT